MSVPNPETPAGRPAVPVGQATPDDIIPATRDWRSVVGMFDDSEFMRQVDAEIQAMRAAEQRALDEAAAA